MASPGEHVNPYRRHVKRSDLKDWIAQVFPSDKPAFLFDEVERSLHPAVTLEAYQTLQTELKSANERLKKAEREYRKLRDEKNDIQKQLDQRLTLPSNDAPNKYDHILIGAMLKLMLEHSNRGRNCSEFASQSAITTEIVDRFGGVHGLSERTINQKFADANRTLTEAKKAE